MVNLEAIRLALVLVTSLASCADAESVRAPQTVEVPSGALTLRGLLWRPDGRGPFPAVLFNHGSGSPDPARQPAMLGPVFVRHGYVFLYLFRRGAGLSKDQGTNSAALMARALADGGQDARNDLQLRLQDLELVDVVAGLAFLRSRPDVDKDRVAVVGHSFGGQLTLLLTQRDKGVRAGVVFGAAAASWEASPGLRARLFQAARETHAPIFFIYAANDFSVAPGIALAAEMERLGKDAHVKIYPPLGQSPGEGHDFVHRGRAAWEPDVFAFLADHMWP